MKAALFFFAAVFFGLLVVPRPAIARCSSELAPGSEAPVLPLPPACRALGPIHLGMSQVALFAALGPPDQLLATSDGLEGAIYAFPRHVGARYAKGPKTIIYIHRDVTGEIQALLRDGKVVSIHVSGTAADAVPFSIGGLAVGQPLDQLLHNAKTQPQWNTARDQAMFAPYPLAVRIDSRTQKIRSITIANGTEL